MTEETDAAVFIVDDDEAVRDSIAELVSSVGLHACTFGSAQQFLDAFDPQSPGCLVLDVRMAKMSGPALQEKLSAQGASIPIVFISGHGDIAVAVKTIKAGAVDFVQKPYRDQHLLDSINEALQRDAERRQAAGVRNGFTERQATLTEREREVMALAVKGLSSKVTAQALGISYRTVELHRSHILDKLGVRSVTELMRVTFEQHHT
jgi:two-component system response regulator DctR